jgi:hypothetical protein
MTRVWKRLTFAVLSILLVLVLAQCKGLKQKAGDSCTHNNQLACTDPSNALLCVNGTLQTNPCRGPHGCQGIGSASNCDDDLGQAGEGCIMGAGGENVACTTDLNSELVCQNNKWVVESTCMGPGHCKISGEVLHCDDDFANVGDPCKSSASDANYSCTMDKKTRIVCTANKFVQFDYCHGPRGCHIEGNIVYCDGESKKPM